MKLDTIKIFAKLWIAVLMSALIYMITAFIPTPVAIPLVLLTISTTSWAVNQLDVPEKDDDETVPTAKQVGFDMKGSQISSAKGKERCG